MAALGDISQVSCTSRSITKGTLRRMRVAVYARDGYRCVRCGWTPATIPEDYDGSRALGEVVIKQSLRGPTTFGCRCLELDHVIPYSAGGLFAFDNLQTLCNSCNASKGARQ